MGYFIEQPKISKYFYSDEEFGILNVGYHNFHFAKPLKNFRTQNFYTWHFVVSGSGTLEIYDKKIEIKSGEMFFIEPNTKMRYYPNSETPWEYVWFAFKGEAIKNYSRLAGFSSERPICECNNFEKTKKVLQKMLERLIEGEVGYFGLMASFYEIMELSTKPQQISGVKYAKKLLDENFSSPTFSLDQVCNDVGISHVHLLRLFKKAYGVTLIQYITKKRIDLACELLKTTDLTVCSVAYSSGFSDEIHFMKAFKKAVGVTALQYRHNHIKE